MKKKKKLAEEYIEKHPESFREHVLSKVQYKVINVDANRELLKKALHRRTLDFAVVYIMIAEQERSECKTYILDNTITQLIGQEELDRVAYTNTYIGLEISEMNNLLQQMGENIPEAGRMPLHVVTDRNAINGASALLFPQMFKGLSDKYASDLWILPSSTHEVIVKPVEEEAEVGGLREIVREMNKTLNKTEVLSDQVYRYIRSQRQIVIATNDRGGNLNEEHIRRPK